MIDLFTEVYQFSEQGVTIDIFLSNRVLRRRIYCIGSAWGGKFPTEESFERIKREEIHKVVEQLMTVDSQKYLGLIKRLMKDVAHSTHKGATYQKEKFSFT